MVKEIIGWALILLGLFSMGNFFAHHASIPLNDDNGHALEGLLEIFFGVFLLKTKVSFMDNWTNFKD